MTEWIAYAGQFLLALMLLGFGFFRVKVYLTFFQQEEYDAKRFLAWLLKNRAVDLSATLLLLLVFGLSWLVGARSPWFFYLAALAMSVGIARSRKILKSPKKPLVMTMRARRIFMVTLILFLFFSALFYLAFDAVSLFLALQLAPVYLLAANGLLGPFEYRVKRRLRAEAKSKIRELKPFVIGITGSYGKTSTKHILAHILSSAAPTLATPGSVNTDMGITRIIREQLEPRHRYFIVEMGAYGPGSIARLCRLAPPKLGIITAIGTAHYERFKSIETVFRAKFELADGVIQNGGQVIVNADDIPEGLMEKRGLADNSSFLLCGGKGPASRPPVTVSGVKQTENGIELTVQFTDGSQLDLQAPVFGLHQACNIALAAIAAKGLGVPDELIRGAVFTLPQTRHRLEVTGKQGGPVIIDDAYNSNPVGFRSALDVLNILSGGKKRRILITPGMVELGARHAEEHKQIGRIAGRSTDITLAVDSKRIPTFVEGFRETAPPDTLLLEFSTQKEAEAWLKTNSGPDDVILFENNLPDLYEAKIRL